METPRSPCAKEAELATRQMTYSELAILWNVSRDAARKKVEGLRLPRTLGNDGRARVMIDLDEISHKPLRPKKAKEDELSVPPPGDPEESAPGDQEETYPDRTAEIEALRTAVNALQDHLSLCQNQIAQLENINAVYRSDFENERKRSEQMTQEVLKLTERLSEAQTAKSDLLEFKSKSWWRRALG